MTHQDEALLQDTALARIDRIRGRKAKLTDEVITLAHGSGGKASATLVDAVFIEAFGAPNPEQLGDAAVLELAPSAVSAPGTRLAFSTDAYVVSPIRFPGASIGELAVNGTVNDVAMAGAQPRWLSAAFVIEEGLPVAELRQIAHEMRAAADAAGVAIVAGDTKVVPRGAADKLFITTAGLGVIPPGRTIDATKVRDGDQVICTGSIAAHGMAVMVARGNLAVTAPIASDSAPLNHLVEAIYAAVPAPDVVRWLRDATRGGVATVLNELAQDSGLGVLLADEAIPVAPAVRGVCDLLGIDPLYVANEGVFLAVVAPDSAAAVLAALHAAGASNAAIIGEVVGDLGAVAIRNAFGGTRLVDMLVGDPLPRIC